MNLWLNTAMALPLEGGGPPEAVMFALVDEFTVVSMYRMSGGLVTHNSAKKDQTQKQHAVGTSRGT